MPSVQIKDVPDETHAVLRRRAALAHQSLQEYLLTKLVEEASTPSLDEVLERAGGRAGGSLSFRDAVAGSTVTLQDADGQRITTRIPAGVRCASIVRVLSRPSATSVRCIAARSSWE